MMYYDEWIRDEECDENRRCVSVEELAGRIAVRPDVLDITRDPFLWRCQSVSIALALLTGLFLTRYRGKEYIPPDFIDRISVSSLSSIPARVIPEPLDRHTLITRTVHHPRHDRRSMTNENREGSGSGRGGAGDYRERVARSSIAALVSRVLNGKDVGTGDPLGKGGFTEQIDGIIAGVNGLKRGGSGPADTRQISGIGFAPGYGESGFGGYGGTGENQYENLGGASSISLSLRRSEHALDITLPTVKSTGRIRAGGRSKRGIMRVVEQNLQSLRYAYHKRLTQKPSLQGKITVKFAIDEFGNVIYCTVVSSTMNDRQLQQVVVSSVRRWKFEKIDAAGDITEVIYPFVFSL
jgi:TonB family protein